jgi:hypothetical protein
MIHKFFSRVAGSDLRRCESAPDVWRRSDVSVDLDRPASLFNGVDIDRGLACDPHGDLTAPDRESRNCAWQQMG